MADRKISELTTTNKIAQNDLYHVVTSPSSTPTNQKVQAHTVHKADYTSNTGYSTITESILTQGGTGQTLKAGYFTIVADNSFGGASGAAVLTTGIALEANVVIGDSDGYTTVTQETAGFKSSVDLRRTGSISSIYSAVIEFSDTTTNRASSPTAFIKLQDTKTASTANVSYVLDLFPEAAYGATLGTNTGPVFTSGANTAVANGAILVRVGGEDKYIMLHDDIA